jgi:uncharacterized RDD family membrane protein YckC
MSEPAWKQEVNRRVAAHMHGKPASNQSGAAEHASPAPGSRAAKAAARVARRFATAPSYNEMLATEARAAVEAAEAAALAAQEAHAKAQMVLAGIEAAAKPEPAPKPVLEPFREPQVARVVPFAPAVPEAPAVEAGSQSEPDAEPFAIQWESDLPERRPATGSTRATRGPISTHGTGPGQETSLFEPEPEGWEQAESFRDEPMKAHPPEIAVIEPAQPIFGNVIEFPRQIVATRKVRPRLAEGPLASSAESQQLSIFEVDPGAISVEPEAESPRKTEQAAWSVPEWSTIRLAPVPEPELELPEEAEPQPHPAPAIELASMSRRLLAGVVDATLVAGACVAAAALAANNATELPGLRAVEIGSLVALLVASAAYKVLFFTLARATPGMKYARLALCTFDGGIPTRAQRWARLAAVLLSILPVGLGFVWAIFDDQHLTWHDRISRTYLRVS